MQQYHAEYDPYRAFLLQQQAAREEAARAMKQYDNAFKAAGGTKCMLSPTSVAILYRSRCPRPREALRLGDVAQNHAVPGASVGHVDE